MRRQMNKIIKASGPNAVKVNASVAMNKLQETLLRNMVGGSTVLIERQIAEVYICLEQLRIIYAIDESDIDRTICRQVERKLDRINKG